MAVAYRRTILRICFATLLAGLALGATGCGDFFVCEKSSCTSSGSGAGTGDYAYVSNSAQGSTYLNAYSLASGTLSSVSGFPASLGYVPVALTISPNNAYLYAATSTGYIYAYSIGSAGGLTTLNNGGALVTSATGISAMDISPDGNFLYALDQTGQILYQYGITTSSGYLGAASSFLISSTGTITPQSVRVSPNGNFVVCALGTGGDVVFPYSSGSGITTANYASVATGSTATGDFGVSIDTNNNLYIARTTGPVVYAVSLPSSTTVNGTSITQPTLTSGNGPRSIVLGSNSGSYVYIGNLTDSTISAYASASGVLSDLVTVDAPSSVIALGRDSTGKYILAAGYNSASGIQLYSIGSNGALSSVASAGSGTSLSVPVALALTH